MDRALELDEDFHAARHGLARCLSQLNDYDGAKAQLSQLLQSEPENIAAMKDLAFVLEQMGGFDQAGAPTRPCSG